MPGRKPESEEELRRRGSWRANVIKAKPVAVYGRPYADRRMSKDAHKVWRKLLPLLEASGVLQPIHGGILKRYCELVVIADRLHKFIDEAGNCAIITKDLPDGSKTLSYIITYPHVKHYLTVCAELRQIECLFGMNPSARTRISLPNAQKQKENSQREKDNARFLDRQA